MMLGFRTLFLKEVLRFWKVGFQTMAAPVLTALLYLLIFAHVLDDNARIHGVAYTSFLVPGLVMMSFAMIVLFSLTRFWCNASA